MAIKIRNKRSLEFSTASMSDLVFLLLIFFMLTSTLVSPNALKVLLPSSSSKTLAKQTISVSINKDLQYFVGTQQVDTASLEAVLKSKLSTEAEPSIVLHVERTVPIQNAVFVMDIANRNKYKLVLATSPK